MREDEVREGMVQFLWSQVWHLPYLIVYVVGLVFTFDAKKPGSYLSLARWGLLLLLLSWLLSTTAQYLLYARIGEGGYRNYVMYSAYSMGFNTLLSLAGTCLLIAAAFEGRSSKPANNA